MKIYLVIGILFSALTVLSQTSCDSTENGKSLEMNLGIGVSLIRNTITPSVHINLDYNNNDDWQIGLNTASYYFFEQTFKADNSKNYNMYINTFLNAEFSFHGFFSNSKSNDKNWNGIGIGYLIGKSGDYFNGSTAKIYYVAEYKHIAIVSELIFTNNFKTVFPGITILF